MNNSNDIRSMLGKAEKNFGSSIIETKITLSDLAEKIGRGTHAKAMIQMILSHKIWSLDRRIAHYVSHEKPEEEAIIKGLREVRDAYEKFALMSEELPQ